MLEAIAEEQRKGWYTTLVRHKANVNRESLPEKAIVQSYSDDEPINLGIDDQPRDQTHLRQPYALE